MSRTAGASPAPPGLQLIAAAAAARVGPPAADTDAPVHADGVTVSQPVGAGIIGADGATVAFAGAAARPPDQDAPLTGRTGPPGASCVDDMAGATTGGAKSMRSAASGAGAGTDPARGTSDGSEAAAGAADLPGVNVPRTDPS